MTDQVEVLGRLQKLFVDYFDDDELVVERSTSAKDVEGWDSLATVELMVEIEQEFGVRFTTGEMATLKNVGQLVDRIAGRLGGGS